MRPPQAPPNYYGTLSAVRLCSHGRASHPSCGPCPLVPRYAVSKPRTLSVQAADGPAVRINGSALAFSPAVGSAGLGSQGGSQPCCCWRDEVNKSGAATEPSVEISSARYPPQLPSTWHWDVCVMCPELSAFRLGFLSLFIILRASRNSARRRMGLHFISSKQVTNRSINQPTNQPTNQTTNQPINHLTKQLSNQLINQLTNLSINYPSKEASK